MVAVAVAVAITALPATPGVAAPGLNVPVHITNKGCTVGYKSVSHQYTRIIFGVFNDGTVAHGFDISSKYKTGLIKAHQEKTLITTLAAKGSYAYACVAAHSTVKRGVFIIR
jgi:hypothetical protein